MLELFIANVKTLETQGAWSAFFNMIIYVTDVQVCGDYLELHKIFTFIKFYPG